jgi:hypothetical protein
LRVRRNAARRGQASRWLAEFAETLALEGIAASIGSVGDAYDNALPSRLSACSRPR